MARRTTNERFTLPHGARSSRERRELARIAQMANVSNKPESKAEELERPKKPSPQTAVDKIVTLRRKAVEVRYLSDPTLSGYRDNLFKKPGVSVLPSGLGRHAVRLFGLEAAQNRTRIIANSAPGVIDFGVYGVSMFFSHRSPHIGLIPDSVTKQKLQDEFDTVSDWLQLREPIIFKSLAIGAFDDVGAADEARAAIGKCFEDNDTSGQIILGGLIPVVLNSKNGS
ncbi:MAG: hypothetical protein M3Q70_01440 [bacterium]|nr:hypothetical protein [bacterium]